MRLRRLDHVALWVEQRDGLVQLAEALGMHVVDETDRFTLVGADARRGKLTLFDAEGRREPGALAVVGLRVPSLAAALAALPPGTEARPGGDGRALCETAEGLRLALVEAPGEELVDLDHVALRCADPAAAREAWLRLGLEPAAPGAGGVTRVALAGVHLELHAAAGLRPAARPLLNHLGVLVDSAEDWRSRADGKGIDVLDTVDAPNTLAVFVRGPEDVRLEYVEHKPGFALR